MQQMDKSYGTWNTASGIAHVTGFLLLLYAIDHITTNLKTYVKFLNSESSKIHAKQVQNRLMNLLNRIPTVNTYTIKKVFNKNNALNYLNTKQKQHVENQKHDIQMRAGMPAVITLPDGSKYHISFYITTLWDIFATGFRDSKELSVQLKSTNGTENIINFVDLLSINEYEDLTTADALKNKENTVTVEIKPSAQESIRRVFRITHGGISDILSISQIEQIEENLSKTAHFSSDKNFNTSGEILNTELTSEQKRLLDEFFKELSAKNGRYKKSLVLSEQEITTMRKAVFRFFLSPAYWTITAQNNIDFWNGTYVFRHTFMHPRILLYRVLYAGFFDRIYKQDSIIPDTFNGGYNFRLKHISQKIGAHVFKNNKIQNSLRVINEFENEIMPIQKEYLKLSTELAILETIRYSIQNKTNPSFGKHDIDHSVQAETHIEPASLSRKNRLFLKPTGELCFRKPSEIISKNRPIFLINYQINKF